MFDLGLLWLAVLVLMVVIEIGTMGLATIWFAGGALVAFLASLLGAGVALQIILFFAVSFLLLGLTRPIAKKYLEKGKTTTNADSLIGDFGVVSEDIDNVKSGGAVTIRGLEWTARSVDGQFIAAGKKVEVLEIQGVKLIVKEESPIILGK